MSFQAVSVVDGVITDGQVFSRESVVGSGAIYRPPVKMSITPGDGRGIQDLSIREVSSGDLRIESGVFSTATNSGSVVRHSSDIKDSTLVTIGGIEMSAKSAAQMGFITRNVDGGYSDGGKPSPSLPATEVEEGNQTEEQHNPALSNDE